MKQELSLILRLERSSMGHTTNVKNYLMKRKILLPSKIRFFNSFYRLGETLLLKETLALPDIVEVLGQRPYPLKATLLEYLHELQDRKITEEQEAASKKAEDEKKAENEEVKEKLDKEE
jgi:hypothetical protein